VDPNAQHVPQQPQQPHPVRVGAARGVHPTQPPALITPEVEKRHKDSQASFPHLSLSAGEYVIEEVRRHPIGLLSIWVIVGFLVLCAVAIAPFYGANIPFIAQVFMTTPEQLPSAALLSIPTFILAILFGLGGVVATIIYNGNKFYITNESIVQYIQTGLFTTKQQVVNLINVEDASSEKVNIVEHLLNYGTLRLSTQGEETIYHFRFVADPQRVVHAINDASERAVKILQGYPASEY
jgi:hypothetical protein